MVAGLKHLASISNPTFHEKERLRFSTWDTPRFIRDNREDLDWLSVPRGLIDPVTQPIADAGSELELTDNRTVLEAIDLEFNGTLQPHQRVAFDAAKNGSTPPRVATKALSPTSIMYWPSVRSFARRFSATSSGSVPSIHST